ncbi:hypothetical protein HJG54_17820 [Leptolyngbya sp. NK1-12]|uniref:Uncharacterized protein n=1 Tax=Leptolyngbya sp. NK1-12 TaxID=2547451 RepID=A0AA96WK98_9CYAN|nr:hypothetical protein HJG54_17820 [Leptolyngbya sp. NK1-12]
MIQQLSTRGINFSADRLVKIDEIPGGVVTKVDATGNAINRTDIVFLEIGRSRAVTDRPAGFVHILEEHAQQFASRGISEEQIADALMTALKQGRSIGVQGTTGDRLVYEFVFNGRTQYVSITVSNNGFIVGANPTPQDLVDQLLRSN